MFNRLYKGLRGSRPAASMRPACVKKRRFRPYGMSSTRFDKKDKGSPAGCPFGLCCPTGARRTFRSRARAGCLLDRVYRAAEAVQRLARDPLQHALGVVAVGEDVVAGRKTVLRALLLHLVELLNVELRVLNRAPVVRRRVHREAGRERAVGAYDERVLARTTLPRRNFAAHQ